MISSHVKISMISVISRLSLKLYLNSLVYHRNISGSPPKVLSNLRKSSDIFGNFRKFSETVRERSSGLRNNFGESSEIFGKWSRFEILASFTFLCAFRCQSHFGQNELKKGSVDIPIMLVYSRASGQPERAKWHPCGITRFLPYKKMLFLLPCNKSFTTSLFDQDD